MTDTHKNHRSSRPFNTPTEYALRLLFLLDAAKDKPNDVQRLIAYDYLLVHSGDVENGPQSLHPAVPFRGTEFLIKRDLIQDGLAQIFARELVDKIFDKTGISYQGNALTTAFCNLMSSHYATELRLRAEWVVLNFSLLSNVELSNYMNENVGHWGAEFDRQTALNQLEL
jgi:hypothetical protein